jgi:hypothetical protein
MAKEDRKMNKGELECSFCGFKSSEVELMIEGPKANICGKCVDLCQDIVTEGREEKKCREAQARWATVSITSLEEAVDLIRACGEATELKYLLDRIDDEFHAKNLTFHNEEDWVTLRQLVNEIKDTLK